MPRETAVRCMVFADVSESSALYQKLGDTAARNIIGSTLTAITALLPRYGGVLVKTIGDAVMCMFPTADAGLQCAMQMQACVANDRPGNYPVAIHVGIAHGSVLLENGDVFGDTVNVSAYLTAVAGPEQILASEATEKALSAEQKDNIRAVFRAVLKGATSESVVYQALWKVDAREVTEINLQSQKVIPRDTGSLIVTHDEERVRIDQWRPTISVGRAQECDLVVPDRYASRRHLTIKLVRTRFYLIDHSINGTFVRFADGHEVHVLREDLVLDGSGEISLGRTVAGRGEGLITFNYDRRSMFRI
ncbi:MAG TPA: adenylate/guanylate cyclase domain-containing protein [Burkholderiales bacterium]|nr:adenylate/guanylate cyclase domain-containing protein [Burkholderiales bacterium]